MILSAFFKKYFKTNPKPEPLTNIIIWYEYLKGKGATSYYILVSGREPNYFRAREPHYQVTIQSFKGVGATFIKS